MGAGPQRRRSAPRSISALDSSAAGEGEPPLPPGSRTLCSDTCHEVFTDEVTMPLFETAGPTKLAELRSRGQDPTKTHDALAKLGKTQRQRRAAQHEWDRRHAGDDVRAEVFQQSIFPLLDGMPLSVPDEGDRSEFALLLDDQAGNEGSARHVFGRTGPHCHSSKWRAAGIVAAVVQSSYGPTKPARSLSFGLCLRLKVVLRRL
jgi:hypothetical protein